MGYKAGVRPSSGAATGKWKEPLENGMGAGAASFAGAVGQYRGTFMESRASGAQVSADQRNMAFASIDFALVSDHSELAVTGLNESFASSDNIALVAQAVADQFRDRQHDEQFGSTLDLPGDDHERLRRKHNRLDPCRPGPKQSHFLLTSRHRHRLPCDPEQRNHLRNTAVVQLQCDRV